MIEDQVDEETPKCPRCGKPDKVIPVVYGYPSKEAIKLEGKGKIILGGCLTPRGKWYKCMRWRCKYEFERNESEARE